MKLLLLTAFATLVLTAHPSVYAAQSDPKLSLSIELKEGDTVVAKPRLIVIAGERASVEVGGKGATGNAEPLDKRQWRVEVTPVLEGTDQVSTKINFKTIWVAADGVKRDRSMNMKTVQKLGEAMLLVIPANDVDPALSLTIKTDIVPL